MNATTDSEQKKKIQRDGTSQTEKKILQNISECQNNKQMREIIYEVDWNTQCHRLLSLLIFLDQFLESCLSKIELSTLRNCSSGICGDRCCALWMCIR